MHALVYRATGGVGRALEPCVIAGTMEQRNAVIKVAYLSEQIIDRDRFFAGVECRHQRLVLHIQPCQDVGDDFIVIQRLASGRQFVGEGADVGVVGAYRLCALLRVGEGDPDVVDARSGLGREHARHSSPELMCLADRSHLDKNFSREIDQQMAKYLLIFHYPDLV